MQGKRRIAKAYQNARSLVATMGRGRSSARPCIEACLKHFNVHKNADDAAAAGWTLAAIQEQLGERNLYGRRRLKEIADAAARYYDSRVCLAVCFERADGSRIWPKQTTATRSPLVLAIYIYSSARLT